MARRTLREWWQDWIGITELQRTIETFDVTLMDQQRQLAKQQESIRTLLPGIGRIIAKHDAMYARSENPLDDPARKEESDVLGEQVIERLKAEDKARRHTLGEP